MKNPSAKDLLKAAKIAARIETKRAALAEDESLLASLLGVTTGSSPEVPAVKGNKRKRTMSPETKAKIAAGQKARWAKVNTAAPSTPTPTPSAKPVASVVG